MTTPDPLETEYRALLERRGLEHLAAPLAPEEVRRLLDQLGPGEREFFADVIQEIRDGGYSIPRENPYDGIKEDLLNALRRSGIALPGPVYVGEYPHNSFNAQACAVPGGTLILVNTGLMTLLYEVAKCIGSSMRILTRTEDHGLLEEEETPELTRQRDDARTTVAHAVLAYIFQGNPGLGGRIPLTADSRALAGIPLAEAARDFVVGHEFGHFLSGHLDGSAARERSGEWIRKSHDQELEADEIGALLMLRRVGDPGNELRKNLAAAGPFLFFAIDHLVTRVRNEVNGIPMGLIVTDHPPSDERAGILRRLFLEVEGPGALQFANAVVTGLSLMEDDILDAVDTFVRTGRPQGGAPA
ncbi:hypothetical protein ABZ912_12790 [Nonomuraea angiospora]|uniref:hypothetical protein n=1 Tax=Nonomuraea angiospora TaxID=46172 RepID=UPI003409E140